MASDWLCLGREGALDPAINIVASLCADVRFFGLAQRMGALAAGFLFLLGADWSGALIALIGPSWIRWSVAFGALSDDPLTQLLWGRGRCIPLWVL